MERMVAKLREVTSISFRFKEFNIVTKKGYEKPVTVEVNSKVWISENALREELRIVEYDHDLPPDQREIKELSRIEVAFPPGRRGLVINHLDRHFLWGPGHKGDFGDSSPVTKLRMVQEREGEIIRELGSKKIGGRLANGFVMKLLGVEKGSGYDALEVWTDAETDLPIEFSFKVKANDWSQDFRLYECRWNVEFDPQLFEPIEPEGYVDTTPPRDQADIDKLVQAIRLYAELSGGDYPRDSQFDSESVKQDMLKLAGFAGPKQQGWLNDAKYQQIQQVQPSIEWLSRIFLNEHLAGYLGKTVTVEQPNKILFWWINSEDQYRVFYGDLRTEIIDKRAWEDIRKNIAG